jgi:coenzyme F420-0:L-glutamate ligase
LKLYAVKTRLINASVDLVEIILETLNEQNLRLEENDVLAISSKIISYAEGRLVKLSEIKPSEKARELARKYSLKPEFAELVLREAEKIYGGVEKAILTLKDCVLAANAGIDNKNVPEDYVVLWPTNTKESARKIHEDIQHRIRKRVAVLIVDSGLAPFRIGTSGLALAVAGFKPIRDHRRSVDLYGKPIMITRHAVADDLAAAAHLLMGEATEKTPIVLIKDAPVDFDEGVYGSVDMLMPSRECIFMGTFHSRD